MPKVRSMPSLDAVLSNFPVNAALFHHPPEPHIFGSIYSVEDEPDWQRRPALVLVGLDSRIGEAHSPPPRLKLARPRRQNVFHPVALRPVGESDDVLSNLLPPFRACCGPQARSPNNLVEHRAGTGGKGQPSQLLWQPLVVFGQAMKFVTPSSLSHTLRAQCGRSPSSGP